VLDVCDAEEIVVGDTDVDELWLVVWLLAWLAE